VLSATALTRVSSAARRFEEVPADKVEIDQFEQRLRYSVENEGFLALIVSPARAAPANQILLSQFPLEVCSLDGLLIRHMKALTAEKRVDWRMVLRADAVPAAERSASRDWGNLQRVVRLALPKVKAELAESPRHVLLTNPGLLARYGQIDLLGELMQSTGRPGGPPGLWILIPSDGQQQKPTLDGQPVPVFTSAQWTRIPELWLAAHQPTAAKAS
jgi:hypothetical protein